MTINLGRVFSIGLYVRKRHNTMGRRRWWKPHYVWCFDHNDVVFWWCRHDWVSLFHGEIFSCYRCDREYRG
jgi:hypothetical protein